MEWICANCAFKPVGYCKIARRSVNGNTPACPGFKRNDEDTIGFRNVWTLPLRMDDYSYAWDQNYVMALTFEDGKNEQEFNEMMAAYLDTGDIAPITEMFERSLLNRLEAVLQVLRQAMEVN